MKWFSHIPIEIKARALRALKKRRLAFTDDTFSSWLGFPSKVLPEAFAKAGICAIPMNRLNLGPSERDLELDTATVESLLRYPLCIELEYTLTELANAESYILQNARADYSARITQYARVMEVYKPRAFAIVQGYDTFSAVARELAIRRNMPVIAFENTALSDRMLWDDQCAITTNRNLSKNFYWRHVDTADASAADAFATRLIAETKRRKSGEHASPDLVYSGSGSARPAVVFLGQVYTDSSVLFGIRSWQTPVRLIRELARLAVMMDFNLWVKLHPKEIAGTTPVVTKPYAKLTYRKLMADAEFSAIAADAKRVMIDHDNRYDTYDLISKADAAVTLNSQAGLEAAIRGVPTVVAGQAFYGELGFTLDAGCPEVLAIQLGRALGMDAARKDESRLAARVFTQIYFERYCIPKSPEAVALLIAKRCFGFARI
jgi:hypothetical protein